MCAAQSIGSKGSMSVDVVVAGPPERLILCPEPLKVQVDGGELQKRVLFLIAALQRGAFGSAHSQCRQGALVLHVSDTKGRGELLVLHVSDTKR